MNNDFLTNLNKSSRAFFNLVWPVCREYLGGGTILDLENDQSEVARSLDIRSGIDFLQLLPDGGTRGLATRVQFGPVSWDSFTIRASTKSGGMTEYQKRRRDIKCNYIRPHVVIQGYVDNNMLLSCAAIETDDLYKFIDQRRSQRYTLPIRVNPDGNRFAYVDWEILEECGIDFYHYSNTNKGSNNGN